MFFHERNVTEKISSVSIHHHPCKSADEVEKHELLVIHVTHSGYKWCERSYHRNKAGIDDGLLPVFFKEGSCFIQSLLLMSLKFRR